MTPKSLIGDKEAQEDWVENVLKQHKLVFVFTYEDVKEPEQEDKTNESD